MLRQRGAGASLSLRLESKLDEFGSHQMGPVVGMGVEAGGAGARGVWQLYMQEAARLLIL